MILVYGLRQTEDRLIEKNKQMQMNMNSLIETN